MKVQPLYVASTKNGIPNLTTEGIFNICLLMKKKMNRLAFSPTRRGVRAFRVRLGNKAVCLLQYVTSTGTVASHSSL